MMFGICDSGFGKGNYVFGINFVLCFGAPIGIGVSIRLHLRLGLHHRLRSRSYSSSHIVIKFLYIYNLYFALYIWYLNLLLRFACAF